MATPKERILLPLWQQDAHDDQPVPKEKLSLLQVRGDAISQAQISRGLDRLYYGTLHARRKAHFEKADTTSVRDRGVPLFLCTTISLLHFAFNRRKTPLVAIFADKSIDKDDLKWYYILEIKYELQFSRTGVWIWKSNAIYT